MIPGIKERVEVELRSCRPFQSEIGVKLAANPVYGSWQGAKHFINHSPHATEAVITKAMYDEYGGEYLREHSLSNLFFPTPTASLSK